MDDGDHMPMLEPSTPDAFTPKPAALAGGGWTATASDQSPAYPASNAVDGNAGTFWHTVYRPVPTPLPHDLTVDLKAVRSVSGVGYLPRQDGTPNGSDRPLRRHDEHGRDDVGRSRRRRHVERRPAQEDRRLPTRPRPLRPAHGAERGRAAGPWSSAAEIEVIGTPAAGPPLPRSGWTATASDASPSYPAGNVLDGNGTTIWHTRLRHGSDTPAPHPHRRHGRAGDDQRPAVPAPAGRVAQRDHRQVHGVGEHRRDVVGSTGRDRANGPTTRRRRRRRSRRCPLATSA